MARGPNGQIKKHRKAKNKGAAPQMREPRDVERKSLAFHIVAVRLNAGWESAGMASMQVLLQEDKYRDYYRLVAFLVDLHGVGLKDAFVRDNVSRRVFDRIDRKRSMMTDAPAMVSATEELARRLVWGGVAWARRHGFHTPANAIQIAEAVFGSPPDMEGDNLPEFGYEGEPLLVGSMENLAPFLGAGVHHLDEE